jgi:hypothetical protein
MAGWILLGLVAVELALGLAVAIAFRRRSRRLRAIGSMEQVNRLVGQAAQFGRRAEDPELSLTDRSALLEETRAALEQARDVMRSQKRPLELPPPQSPNGNHALPAETGESGRAGSAGRSPGRERPAA